MKLNSTVKKILLEREDRIALHKKSLERSLQNVQSLQEEIKIEEKDLVDFKKTIDGPLEVYLELQ